jgi:hypothetical protein
VATGAGVVGAGQTVLTLNNYYNVSISAKISDDSGSNELVLYAGSGTYQAYSLTTSFATYSLSNAICTSNGSSHFYAVEANAGGKTVTVDTMSAKAARLNSTNGPSGAYASDSSGNGYHATLTGFSTDQIQTAWVPHGDGLALTFDGTDDYAQFTSINCGTTHTLSMWLKSTDTVGMFLSDGTSQTDYAFYFNAGQQAYQCDTGGSVSITDANTGDWRFLTVVRSGLSVSFYVNGIQVETTKTLPNNGALTLDNIGGRWNNGSLVVGNGTVDDVRIYNVALTPTQVAELYTLTESQEVTGATAIAQWRFNDGPASQTASDGEPVAAWESIDSNRHVFRQTNILKRPKWIQNGLNGKPVVRFDGVDDLLETLTGVLSGESGTVVGYYKLTATPNAYQYWFSQANAATADQFMGLISRGDAASTKAGLGHRTGATTAQYAGNTVISSGVALCAVWDSTGTTYSMRINGVLQTLTFVSGSNSGNWWSDFTGATRTVIGAMGYITPAYFSPLDLAELIVYNRVLTAAELARELAYGIGEFGVSP